MTVRELLSRVSSAELTEWMAHDALTKAERDFEMKKAEQGMR